jgi:hypothetical protein
MADEKEVKKVAFITIQPRGKHLEDNTAIRLLFQKSTGMIPDATRVSEMAHRVFRIHLEASKVKGILDAKCSEYLTMIK